MGNRCFKLIFAVAVLVTAAALFAQGSRKSRSKQDPEEITRLKLEAIQKEIGALRDRWSRLNKEESSVLAMLSQYDLQSEIQRQEIKLIGVKQEKVQRDIDGLLTEQQRLQKNLAEQKEYLTRRLIDAYKLGEMNYLKLFVRANQSADFLRSYQYIAYLAKDDKRKVQSYQTLLVDLAQTHLRLEQEKQNMIQLKKSMQAAYNSLRLSRKEKLALLSSIRTERNTHLNALNDLRTAAFQLKEFFGGVQPSMPAPLENKPSITRLKGKLDWPVFGRVIRSFGAYKHPRFGTTTMSNGVEIAAPEGMDVHAVYDGQVVFAEMFKGYGRSVILSHSDGYYTLYAHNSEILVQRGQTVRKAQVIAKVGSTGIVEGTSSLYFELRRKDEPINPLEWLRRR
jgi:septal ring factor EnvC (AmiA/AmiB activator)